MATRVTVYEVSPRDGLQNEGVTLSTHEKLLLIGALADSGLSRIEATSFVSPKWIPQLADASEVLENLPRRKGTSYVVLVPNARGLDRLVGALDRAGSQSAPVDAAVFLSASETHNKKNVNKSVAESLTELESLVPAARAKGLRVRGYVSTLWGCPYEGEVDPGKGAAIVEQLLSMGVQEVSLGDTIGVGTPNQTRRILDLVLAKARPDQLALHMHDTRGTALANVLVGLEAGLTTFDASVGGLGGCPYAPGASGNLATEDLVYLLNGMGYETGIDLKKLVLAGALAQRLVGHPLPGKVLKAELANTET